jgi:hypothetical protein
MLTYHITEVDSRVIVGTEQEEILVCSSLKMAHRVVADARLLENSSARQILLRRALYAVEDDVENDQS